MCVDDDDIEVSENYVEWLEFTGNEDTEETRGWFDCPEEERADYIRNHQEWWSNYGDSEE